LSKREEWKRIVAGASLDFIAKMPAQKRAGCRRYNERVAECSDDLPTIASIACLAFIIADVAHEVIGHGLGFWMAGGHAAILTTTRLNESQRLGNRGGDLFDLGGPFGNLLFAALAWLALRFLREALPGLRLWLALIVAFSLFWAFAYLMFCGVFGHGDWLALIRGVSHQWVWRILFVAVGFLLYRVSIRLAASQLRWIDSRSRGRRLLLTSYLAGGAIACAGAAFDPRGPFEIFNSGALSSFGAAVGLLEIPRQLGPFTIDPAITTIERSVNWIVAAALCSLLYIFVLGPGVKVHF
jgi:hypothetical protein